MLKLSVGPVTMAAAAHGALKMPIPILNKNLYSVIGEKIGGKQISKVKKSVEGRMLKSIGESEHGILDKTALRAAKFRNELTHRNAIASGGGKRAIADGNRDLNRSRIKGLETYLKVKKRVKTVGGLSGTLGLGGMGYEAYRRTRS